MVAIRAYEARDRSLLAACPTAEAAAALAQRHGAGGMMDFSLDPMALATNALRGGIAAVAAEWGAAYQRVLARAIERDRSVLRIAKLRGGAAASAVERTAERLVRLMAVDVAQFGAVIDAAKIRPARDHRFIMRQRAVASIVPSRILAFPLNCEL